MILHLRTGVPPPPPPFVIMVMEKSGLRYHRLPTLISLSRGFLLVALCFLCLEWLDHSSPGFLVVVPVHAYH